MMRILAGILVVLPLLIGTSGPCPEPPRPALAECPFPVDPNLVVGTLLGWVRLEVGRQLTHTRTWCEPNGDPADAEIVSGPEGVRIINRHKASAYTLLWTPTQPMTTAIVVRVTDRPISGPPRSSTGTILVQVVPPKTRLAPRMCGGQPP